MSNLKILRKFNEFDVNCSEDIKFSDKDSYLRFSYYNLGSVFVYDEYSRPVYIYDIQREANTLILLDTSIKLDVLRDIENYDDLELVLKYGREITDDHILRSLSNILGKEITIDFFSDFLFYEINSQDGI